MRPALRWRVSATILVATVLFGTACAVEEHTSLPHCLEGGSGLIVAQSVPTGEYIPCLMQLPAGWEAGTVRVDQSGTEISFDSDRAGIEAARLNYEESCELGDAVSSPSDKDGAERFDRPERLLPGFRERWFYVFPGGCVWWTFDFDDGISSNLAVELSDQLELLSRVDVNTNIRDSFIDEEL